MRVNSTASAMEVATKCLQKKGAVPQEEGERLSTGEFRIQRSKVLPKVCLQCKGTLQYFCRFVVFALADRRFCAREVRQCKFRAEADALVQSLYCALSRSKPRQSGAGIEPCFGFRGVDCGHTLLELGSVQSAV